jgi:DNA primase
VIRSEYVKECSNLLMVEEAMLYHEINKMKNAELEKQNTQGANRTNQNDENSAKSQNTDEIGNPAGAKSPMESVNLKFVHEERNIVQALIKYGQMTLFHTDPPENEAVSVATYILEEILSDGIGFHVPIHQQILSEYQQMSQQPGFQPEKYFLFHPNREIATLTADLITEKYALSKIHSKMKKIESEANRLFEYIPRLVFEFKNSLLLDEIKSLLLQLKAASEVKNYALANEIMQVLAEKDQIKQQIAKTLGERIITRF